MSERPQLFHFQPVFEHLRQAGRETWAENLQQRCHHAVHVQGHGNLNDWTQAWNQLPLCPSAKLQICNGRVTVHAKAQTAGSQDANAVSQHADLVPVLQSFHPWRKGPFELFGVHIDTEWRSDWKWDRLHDHIELRDRDVLDVGCGNGYYGWRMLDAGARLVVGLDPFLLYVMQHEVFKRYAADRPNFVLPVGDDCLPPRLHAFDVTLSMGVLYHRTSPIDHLQALAATLRPGGQLVLETLILDQPTDTVLMPDNRYAKMRNVWFLPTLTMLQRWLKRSGFRDARVVDVNTTSLQEQRQTSWMTFESLSDFLDPEDVTKTIEGYPAPVRAIVVART